MTINPKALTNDLKTKKAKPFIKFMTEPDVLEVVYYNDDHIIIRDAPGGGYWFGKEKYRTLQEATDAARIEIIEGILMDTEYILRIILRARDEMAKVLAKVRGELRAFGNDAKSMKGEIDKLNSSISGMNRRLGGLTDKLEKWRQTVRGARSETE